MRVLGGLANRSHLLAKFTAPPVLALSLLGLAAGQSAPRLALSTPAAVTHNLPGGKVGHLWKVLLTNNYHAVVTAYAIRYNGGLTGHGGVRWDDALPGGTLVPALPPGQTASITLPEMGVAPPDVENTAVIYADGATAGEPTVVSHFLMVRSVFLAELPPTIARLNAMAADPGADRNLAIAYFQHREENERRLMSDAVAGPRLTRVAGAVVANLTHNTRNSVPEIAGALARLLTQWRGQLSGSLPKLAVVAFPTTE